MKESSNLTIYTPDNELKGLVEYLIDLYEKMSDQLKDNPDSYKEIMDIEFELRQWLSRMGNPLSETKKQRLVDWLNILKENPMKNPSKDLLLD